jgi:hypothetical protein
MDYVKTQNGSAVSYPYSIWQLRQDNSNTSFPEVLPEEILAAYGMYAVTTLPQPTIDPLRQKLAQDALPSEVDGQWQIGWAVVALTAQELVEVKARQQANRQAAYTAEADPLFFMSQRGEATVEEWQAKVAEIKARYPYPVA